MKNNIFINRCAMACAISIVIAVVGFISMNSLPVEQYPNISPPSVEVTATYTGADVKTQMKSVIAPLEEEINGVSDMTYMTSKATSTGNITITVYFKQGVDPDIATVNVKNRVAQAEATLPADVTNKGINVAKKQNSILRIVGIQCTNGKYDSDFLSNWLDINLTPRLKRITGVGDVRALGNTYALRVWMKPDVLAQYGLEPNDVINAINSQSFVSPTGSLGEQSANSYQYTMKYKGTLTEVDEFYDIVVATQDGGHILYLRDVAEVEIGAESYNFMANVSGDPGAIFMVFQSPGANATEVNTKITELLEKLKPTMPDGLKFVTLQTSDDFLFAAIDNVVETLIIAIILVILVVFFFLQNLKATVIPSLSIIVSLMGTFAIVMAAGFSLNILTLFALVLAIGTVVDDAIVVVEAVMGKMESGITDAREATRQAMSEVSVAVISCTLVFMAVFIPVCFMSGTSGTFFTQFGVTIASSVGLSCVSAMTLCPALCGIMLKATEDKQECKSLTYYTKKAYNASYNAILYKYSKSVQVFIKRPVISWGLLAIAGVLLFFFMRNLPSGLVPQEDQGVFMVEVRAPEGYTLQQTYDLMKQVEEKAKQIPEMECYSVSCGFGLISGNGSSYATLVVRLVNWDERPGSEHNVEKVINRFSASCRSIKNAKVIAFQTPQIPGYGTSNGVSLKVEDPMDGDMSEFSQKTDAFLAKLQQRPEIGVALSTYSERFPQYEVIVDAAQCDRSGVSVKTIVNTLGSYCSGSYIGNYNKFGKVYKIMVAAAPEYRLDEASLHNIFVKVKGGRMAPLAEFISLKEVVGPSLLEHFNCYQSISCNITIAPGYSEGEAQNAIAEVFKQEMPKYTYEYSDMSREVEETANSNTTTIIYCICVILIYLILVSLYESWFIPWAVLLSVPFGLMGALSFAYVCSLFGMSGMDNNVYLQTGVIMLIGLLSKTAILITEVASEHRKQGMTIAEAAFAACKERLRPILMTVATMIIGMIPLIIEGGAGANGNRVLALGVVGGMSIGTVAILFVVPAFFIVSQKLHERFQSTPKVVEVKEI
jgi:hydrophobe/amphiphile efflux-1 (HAE1) family protein